MEFLDILAFAFGAALGMVVTTFVGIKILDRLDR